MAKVFAKTEDKAPKKRKYTRKDDHAAEPVEAEQPQPPVAQAQPQAPVVVAPPPAVQPPVVKPPVTNGSNGNNGQSHPPVAAANNGYKTDQEKKAEYESTHAKYERIKRGNLHITDLQKMTVAELHDVCKKEGVI